jgi:putative aminopeptidase FrvX
MRLNKILPVFEGGKNMLELLRQLAGIYGPSGREKCIRKVIEKRIKSKVDEIYTDTLGNLIAVKKGAGKRIMLAAHMDEIGLIATYIDEKGFIRFSNIGGVNPWMATGQRVCFQNGTVGTVYYEETLEHMKDLKLNRMYIDIGTKSREETRRFVNPGDMCVFAGETQEQNGRYISKALDNRIGCAILITLIERLENVSNELVFAFTVQEEVGLRGAGTAAYQIKPDIAVAVDVTNTGDTPESKPLSIELGKGPAIMIKDSRTISHPIVKDTLINCAKSRNIPYQLEVLSVGGNDAGTIHTAAGGIPTGAVSVPCRYMHSPSEMVDKNDIDNAVKLLSVFVSDC